MMNTIFFGSQVVLNVHIEPIDGVTASEYDFSVQVYCSPKREVSANKEGLIQVDDSNYLLLLDTEDVGLGDITCRVVALLPDSRFESGYRKEVNVIETGLTIVKA